MNSPAACIPAFAVLVTLASVGPAFATEAIPIDLPGMERAWHSCVRKAYDRQPEQGGRAGRGRNALYECKGYEDAYVAALMAARPDDADMPVRGWARTWAAYVAFVLDPVKAWIDALRR